MSLRESEIEDLLRGDLSDIEDFNDIDDNEETIILQRIAEMADFIDDNNAEIDNIVIHF